MSTTAIIGTLGLYLDDGEDNQEIASLLSVQLSMQTKMRPALSPRYIAGTQGWRAQGQLLQLVDDVSGDRESYLTLIETAAMDKTLLSAVFVSPTGAEYTGSAYIETFQVGQAESEVYSGSFALVGVGALVRVEGPAIFMVGDDDSFYTMYADFSAETDTELDLSTYNIISIDRNQVTGRIYGLGSTGVVYSWEDDGTDFQTVFTAPYGDFTKLFIDNSAQNIGLSLHAISGASAKTYTYTLAGVAVANYEHFEGISVKGVASAMSSGNGYVYLQQDTGTNSKNLYRLDMSDGDLELTQNIIIFGSSGAVAWDEVGKRAWRFIINNLYLYSIAAESSADASFVVGLSADSGNDMDFFEYGGDGYVIGCADGGPLWSHKLGSGTYVANRTSNDMRLVCTKRGYVS